MTRKPINAARHIDFGRVNSIALRNFPAILAGLIPDGKLVGSEFAARNPTRCDRRPGSFKINVRTGKWGDFATRDAGGDPVSLVAYLDGVSQIEAARRLSRIAGHAGGECRAPRPINTAGHSHTKTTINTAMRRLWREAGEPRGTIVERYLASRQLGIPDGLANRVALFHPRCLWESGTQPCMVVLMRSIETCEPSAIQRTALTPDATKTGRKMLGIAGGAAIMLDPLAASATELTIGEGFETALTAHQLGQRPVWALGSVGAIAKFPVLDRVAILNILAEAGDPSARAIDECADRWMDAGREVFLVSPKAGSDLNDALRLLGASP